MFCLTRLLQASYLLGLLLCVSLLARPGASQGQFRGNRLPPQAALPPLNNLNTDSTGNFLAGSLINPVGGLGGFNGLGDNCHNIPNACVCIK